MTYRSAAMEPRFQILVETWRRRARELHNRPQPEPPTGLPALLALYDQAINLAAGELDRAADELEELYKERGADEKGADEVREQSASTPIEYPHHDFYPTGLDSYRCARCNLGGQSPLDGPPNPCRPRRFE